MRIAQLELDDEFEEVFTRWGTHTGDCHCGREHVCIDSYAFNDYEDLEEFKANIRERAEEDDKLIIHENYDHVSMMEIGGRQYVSVCECEGWKPYMDFILTHRCEIRDFLIKVADKAQNALEHEKSFNILKDYKFKVLDEPKF